MNTEAAAMQLGTEPLQQLEMLRLAADSVQVAIACYDLHQRRCRFANRTYLELFGWTPETILGKTLEEAVGPETWGLIKAHWAQVDTGREVRYVRHQPRPDGSLRVLEVVLNPHFGASGKQLGAFVLITDITERWRIEQELRDCAERMRKFADATTEAIVFHKNGVITDCNSAAMRLTGRSSDQLLGHHISEFVPMPLQHLMQDYMAHGGEYPYESAVLDAHGRQIPVEIIGKTMPSQDGAYRLNVVRDIRARKEAQARIEYMAHHDGLTGLLNRSSIESRLDQLLNQTDRQSALVAVLYLDVDNFKTINDSLGHHAGDQLLREVGCRISEALRPTDLVARLGGDEFLIVLNPTTDRQQAAALASNLIQMLNTSFQIAGKRLSVSPSIGISMHPDDGNSADVLVRHADSAMYHAKESGRRNYQFYSPRMNTHAMEALTMEGDLRHAIQTGQLMVQYQPILNVADNAVSGVEALVRWQHPERGLLAPKAFIGFAESRGLIVALGRWVLHEACKQVRAWQDLGLPRVRVAVNLSAVEFRQRDLTMAVTAALEATGLAAEYLELELTESLLMEHDGRVTQTLNALRALGVQFSVDDFGTGYSSLAYLKRYPIDKLKIDRSFVHDLEQEADSHAIVTAIIQMARSLHLHTVAEGVETPGQLAALQALGCDFYQGELISPPLSAPQAAIWLSRPPA